MRRAAFSTILLLMACLAAMPLMAGDWCRDDGGWHRDGYHCEVREISLGALRSIEVDSGQNGGISVEGWDRSDVLIQVKVAAHAGSDAEAADLVSQVSILTDGVIRASGPPKRSRHQSWWASFRVSAPRQSDLNLEANNGGISVDGIDGWVRFDTTNGGVELSDMAGDVRGETTNGGVRVRLSGSTWEGEGLDVETTNGGVRLLVPEDYNARLETGTTNGGLEIDFPVTIQGKISRDLEVDLGSGGPTIRVMTTNGGVRVDRR